MRYFPETPSQGRARFWFVCALFLVLLALAHGAAELKAWLDSRSPVPGHTVVYYRVIFTIWATIALLTPALCFHVFSRSNAPNSYWRAFWTFAYLAFAAHLYWTVFGTFHGDFYEIFHSQVAAVKEKLVEHPGPDFFLAAWCRLYFLLAWVLSDNLTCVRVQRGAIHPLAFTMFFAAFSSGRRRPAS